jgi:hypothetical protein
MNPLDELPIIPIGVKKAPFALELSARDCPPTELGACSAANLAGETQNRPLKKTEARIHRASRRFGAG